METHTVNTKTGKPTGKSTERKTLEEYKGQCHCGAIQFQFNHTPIQSGLRCNCSLCLRKGILMSHFTLKPSELTILDPEKRLTLYEFGTGVAKHYFCSRCGIYPFHQTRSVPGEYRINLGCIENLALDIQDFDLVDGMSFNR